MNYFISMLSTTGGKLKVSPKEILKNYKKIKKYQSKKRCCYWIWNYRKNYWKIKIC